MDGWDVLFRHDHDMPLGRGRFGRERDGVLGVKPDAICRYGTKWAGGHNRQHNTWDVAARMRPQDVSERKPRRYNRRSGTTEPLLPRFYDFFAGAGLATLGLGPAWECVWANDIDPRKEAAYIANFGEEHFVRKDVANVSASDFVRPADLAWASFPCQDLSLAGWRRGLSAERSGTFWPFWRIMHELHERGERPSIIVIENVTGLLYGDSFVGLCEALAGLDMQYGALVMDARRFLPQSRPRVFVVCVDSRVDCSAFTSPEPVPEWTPKSLSSARALLDNGVEQLWRWWNLPAPNAVKKPLSRIIQRNPTGVEWHTPKETRYLLSLMNDNNLKKVEDEKQRGGRQIGLVYKRIRQGVQRAEVRFDGLAGCLRTPKGGSSRQTVVVIEDGTVRSRLLSPREAARLMGVEDTYKLPKNYNDGYRAMGDGVAVPVVRWLSERLLLPLAEHVSVSLQTEPAQERLHPGVHDFRRSSERRAAEWLMSRQSKSELLRS
jgi:DNA (cytosine-5)-methyltransferase 1